MTWRRVVSDFEVHKQLKIRGILSYNDIHYKMLVVVHAIKPLYVRPKNMHGSVQLIMNINIVDKSMTMVHICVIEEAYKIGI